MTHSFVCFIDWVPKRIVPDIVFLECVECFKTTLKYGGGYDVFKKKILQVIVANRLRSAECPFKIQDTPP